MGTGKTWIIINNIADLWASGDCDAALILAPNGVHSNWTRLELPKHMPDWVRFQAVAWNPMPKKTEKEDLLSIINNEDSSLRILTMNWEALQTGKGLAFAKKFVSQTKKLMIVADESDSIKNPSAKRTKALFDLKDFAKWRRIMSGTPINNAPFDAYTQFNFLDDSILGVPSFYAFKAEYAEMLPRNNPLVAKIRHRTRGTPQIVARGKNGAPKYQNLDKLSNLIAPHSFRVLKSECLDLPEKIYKTIFFDLTPEQSQCYKEIKEECRIVFEGEESIFNKLVAITKLSQVTSGYVLIPEADEAIRIPGENPKLKLLVERIKSITGKIIVWARYRAEIEDITNALDDADISYVEYHGGISKKDRTAAIDEFENGDAKIFIGNQQAGGTGITLVAASFVIYFSNNFSLRDRLQSEDRAHRIGQSKNVTYINIVAKNTIDEIVVKALLNKKDVAETIIKEFR